MRLATVGTDRIGLIEADRITDVTPVVGIGGTMSAMRRLIEGCADAGDVLFTCTPAGVGPLRHGDTSNSPCRGSAAR